MNRDVVASSGVAAIGYDPPTQTLEVEFLKGSVYSTTVCLSICTRTLCKRHRKGDF